MKDSHLLAGLLVAALVLLYLLNVKESIMTNNSAAASAQKQAKPESFYTGGFFAGGAVSGGPPVNTAMSEPAVSSEMAAVVGMNPNKTFTDASGVQYLCDDYGMCYKFSPVMTADMKGTPLFRGTAGLGRYPGDEYPTDGCDLARLHTGRPDGSLGSPMDPTTLTFPELVGFYGTGVQTAYTPNEMAAMRTRDGLIHAGWVNNQQPGYVLTNSDRWNTGYKYQVGSSIQVVS